MARKHMTKSDILAEQQRREIEAVKNTAIAKKKCSSCLTTGVWEIYSHGIKTSRVRYIRCKVCGHRSQIILPRPQTERT